MTSVDPRRTQPFCTPTCYRQCRCSRWPDYENRFGWPVRPVTWTPAEPTTGGGFLPEHWYRSDGPLWQDAGVTPAVADGDPVGRWEDLTANADHVNQAVVANKPTLQNGAGDLLNGQPVIRFDGTNDHLTGAYTTGGALSQPFTVFAVGQLDASVVNDNTYRFLTDGDDFVNRMVMGQGNPWVPDAWYIYAGINVKGDNSNANWNIWTALYNGAGSQFWHNGLSENTGNAGAHNADGLTIGAQPGGALAWKGDITEIIIYDVNLSNVDKNQVGRYLADRYGLGYTDI